MSKSKPTEEESEPGALGKRLVATLLGCLGKVGACRPGMDREGGLRRPRNLVPDSSKKKGGGRNLEDQKAKFCGARSPERIFCTRAEGSPELEADLALSLGRGRSWSRGPAARAFVPPRLSRPRADRRTGSPGTLGASHCSWVGSHLFLAVLSQPTVGYSTLLLPSLPPPPPLPPPPFPLPTPPLPSDSPPPHQPPSPPNISPLPPPSRLRASPPPSSEYASFCL